MEFYIRVDGGKIIGHPISSENYKQCFPNHDINTVPPGYAEFRRIEKPSIGHYEKCPETGVYDWDGNIVFDRWDITPLTEKEKKEKISKEISRWENSPEGKIKYPSWIFNEEECRHFPPKPLPKESLLPNQFYEWDEESVNWKIVTNTFEFAPQWPMTSPF
jgi:hypothetical protein